MTGSSDRSQRSSMSITVIAVSGVVVAASFLRHHQVTGHWVSGTWGKAGWVKSLGDDESDAGVVGIEAETVMWCAYGLEAIPGGGCLKTPEPSSGHPAPWPLIVYLHGIFEPLAASDELSRQSRVAALGVAKGFAVLALRGHVGQCSAPEYATRVCWPSNERNEDAGPAYVSEWTTPLAVAVRRGATGGRYVFGFSNGGYFSGLLAQRGWFDATAFVVSRGGPVTPVKAAGRKHPLLLTLSADDPSHDEMMKLDDALTQEEWPHEVFLGQGGHALPDSDIQAAVAFFAKHEAAR